MQQLISNFELISSNVPGLLLWEKDISSTYVWSNMQCAEHFGYKKPQDMIGQTDYDVPYEFVELASIFQECDKKVIDACGRFKYFEILKSSNSAWKILLVTKIPKIDQKGIISGTLGHAMDITVSFAKIACLLSATNRKNSKEALTQSSYLIGQNGFNNIKLSQRESECLFFYLRNRSAKEIGKLLRLSSRTVEYYIERLKMKFGCQNKAELFDISVEQGFLNIIPEHIFNTNLSIQLSN